MVLHLRNYQQETSLLYCLASTGNKNPSSRRRRFGGGANGGVDLILGRDGKVTLVQCKRWDEPPIGVRQVRKYMGFYTIAERAQQSWSRPLALRRMRSRSRNGNQSSSLTQTGS